jgi:pyruvate,water dikinase
MKWFQSLFRDKSGESQAAFKTVQEKFGFFRALLDKNNQVLKVMSDLEEKSQGDYLFDLNYIRANLALVRAGVKDIIESMIALGGEEYLPLRDRFAALDAEIDLLFPGSHPPTREEFILPLSAIGRERVASVGGKNAQLGEIARIGLPVPDGFAISAWSYRYFVEANDLQDRISRRLKSLDLKSFDELERVSREIQALVVNSPVPEDLAVAIRRAAGELIERSGVSRFAMRSSALGEDTHFSFAGQYATFLNIRLDEVVERYREALASKFSPKAIYYFLSHELLESDLPMSAGCVAMVDAAVSGVIYTRDPLRQEDDYLTINSVWGLGRYLVDGVVMPDIFRVSRLDASLIAAEPALKTIMLTLDPEGGTREQPVPEAMQGRPSIRGPEIKLLTETALKIEEHYGVPQDIEWSIDRGGRLFIFQTRPLRMMPIKSKAVAACAVNDLSPLLKGGVTVCPGAGSGPVYHAASARDLSGVPEGAVLIAPSPFPGLIMALNKINALVTETGGAASHMATIAREYRLPTLAGVEWARNLPAGGVVTVDATQGVIYEGRSEELIAARCPEYELFEDTDIMALLKKILARVSVLSLRNPEDFTIASCKTFHDLTRFAHQKAMEEMFAGARDLEHRERIGLRLQTEIPLQVDVIYLDQPPPEPGGHGLIREDEIASEPMAALWQGIKEEGWPRRGPEQRPKGLAAVRSNGVGRPSSDFSEDSYALLSREYMLLSLRMGYHFTTVEAVCTETESKNYIHMQYKEGGAPIDRRSRRINILAAILNRLGFENESQADFLDAIVTYQDGREIRRKLRLLGRIAMMTKQLDMALSNDAIADWYTEDFIKRLGLDRPPEQEGERE